MEGGCEEGKGRDGVGERWVEGVCVEKGRRRWVGRGKEECVCGEEGVRREVKNGVGGRGVLTPRGSAGACARRPNQYSGGGPAAAAL